MRLPQQPHGPAGRQEVAVGILRVDARFDRVARAGDLVLLPRQPLAGGDPELPLDEVDPGHELGHRMLDLESGVHLDEVERVGVVARDDELDGPGVRVLHARARGDRTFTHRRAGWPR